MEKIQFGWLVKDSITGFTGIATARCEYMTGNTQIMVEATALAADGKKIDGEWFLEPRLTILEKR
jgi:hypothetical protein